MAPEDGARRVRTTLRLLDHDDPLYTSALDLGDRYKLFGIVDTWFRQGPPGMNYYAPPALQNLADLAAFWDINPKNDTFFELLGENPDFFDSGRMRPVLDYQRGQFLRRIGTVLENG